MSWLTWLHHLILQPKDDERLAAAVVAVDGLKKETAEAVEAFRRIAQR